METWGLTVIKDGHCMTAPFPVAPQAGPFFTSEPAADATLEAWFDDGPYHDRLLPIARVSADGSIGALWRDDDFSAWIDAALSLLGTPGYTVTALPAAAAALTLTIWAAVCLAAYAAALIRRDA